MSEYDGRMGRLPEAWIAPRATRELRELVRHRAKLVALRSDCRCELHAVLAKLGSCRRCSGGRTTSRRVTGRFARPSPPSNGCWFVLDERGHQVALAVQQVSSTEVGVTLVPQSDP